VEGRKVGLFRALGEVLVCGFILSIEWGVVTTEGIDTAEGVLAAFLFTNGVFNSDFRALTQNTNKRLTSKIAVKTKETLKNPNNFNLLCQNISMSLKPTFAQ